MLLLRLVQVPREERQGPEGRSSRQRTEENEERDMVQEGDWWVEDMHDK